MSLRLLRISFLLALALSACDEGGSADAGTDAATECEPIAPFEEGDATGHADPLSAAAGESRAGVLSDAQIPPNDNGLGTWAAGDFVLANDRVALVIEDAGDSDLYDPHGGRPVAIAQVEGGALVRPGDFNELILGWSGFLVRTETVTVMNDGSDGEAAVVRARGTLGKLEFAGELLDPFNGPDDYTGLPAAIDYEMAPGSDSVDLYLWLAQPEPETVRARFLVSAFFQHYRMPLWTEASGFGPAPAESDRIVFVDDDGTSYAWSGPNGDPISRLIEQSGVLIYTSGRPVLAGCSSERFQLGRLTLGGPGLSGVQEALARERGETLRTITGTIEEDDGSPADDVRVHVRRADGSHFARVIPEAGAFTVAAPNEAVTLFAYREGQALVGPIEVGASEGDVTITMPPFATITVDVTDAAAGGALPARVQIVPTTALPAVPEDLGERTHGSRAHVAFTTTGSVSLRVDPGEHRVIASRGYEYEIATSEPPLNVAAGDTATFSASLDRIVDTTNVFCADYHIHTNRSPDSPDPVELKLAGLIADGLEIAIRSDHEWVNDFQPAIERMGLSDWAFGIGGEELTTFAWGHFGVFPLEQDETRVNGGAIPWVGRLPPAVFDDVRARPERPALIMNHPRSGGAIGGYFEAAGFDPTTGTVSAPEYWDEEFTLIEVFNDDDLESVRDSVLADWFSLLNTGRPVFAVGSSDSHSIYGSPVGYPRTCLLLETDDLALVNANMVRDATAAGESTISGGLYLTVVGPDGVGPGATVTGAGESALFDVTVQAASWIDGVDRLEVIVDGESVETIPITETDRGEGAIRLQATGISVPVAAEGSWVVFHAAQSDANDLSPVHPGRRAFAVSNPIFLER